jgi:hypothetical protein
MRGIQERWQVYQLDTGAIANTNAQQDYEVATDSDAPFCLRGLGCFFPGGGSVELRYARPDGRWAQRDLVALQPALLGGLVSNQAKGGEFAPVFPNTVYPPRSVIAVQILNIFGAQVDALRLSFVGTKLYPPGAVSVGEYPAKYRARPFDVTFSVSVPAVKTVRDVQIPLLREDFVWSIGSHAVTSGTVTDVGVIVRDKLGKPYMSDFIWIEQIFGSGFGERGGIPFPGIYLPANEVLTFDFKRNDAGGETAVIACTLRGHKVTAE